MVSILDEPINHEIEHLGEPAAPIVSFPLSFRCTGNVHTSRKYLPSRGNRKYLLSFVRSSQFDYLRIGLGMCVYSPGLEKHLHPEHVLDAPCLEHPAGRGGVSHRECERSQTMWTQLLAAFGDNQICSELRGWDPPRLWQRSHKRVYRFFLKRETSWVRFSRISDKSVLWKRINAAAWRSQGRLR